jgi:hypothetical protein
MTLIRINLIRGRAPGAQARQRILIGMLLYLALCGILLVLLSGNAARRLVETRNLRASLMELESQFQSRHGSEGNLVFYGRSLNSRLDSYARLLEKINLAYSNRTDLARVVLALAAPLPSDARLHGLSLKPDKKILEFDVDFAVESAGETIDASQLIAAWNRDQNLTSQVSRVNSVRSQKKSVDGRLLENWHFTTTLLRGGS